MPGERQELAWSVITHDHKEHSVDWYWAFGLLTIAGAAASIFFGNFLLAIILILAASSIAFLIVRGPREHVVKIDERGLSIDGTRYQWNAIHSFWVEHDEEKPRLFITMKGVMTPHFSLVLDDKAQGAAVREHLRRRVEEEEQGPHIGERLAEMVGL